MTPPHSLKRSFTAVISNFSSWFVFTLLIIIIYILLCLNQRIIDSVNINFVVPIFISAILLTLERLFNAYNTYGQYQFLEGHYECYSYIDEDKTPHDFKNHTTLKDEKNGDAEITYLRNNILNIRVQNSNNLTWEGDIVMHLERSGIITWRYTKLNNALLGDKVHVNGFKRCNVWVDNDNKRVWLYLYSDNDERYGRETLVKKEKEIKSRE